MRQQAQSSQVEKSAVSGLGRPVLISAILFLLISGVVYPLVTTGVAQILFHRQAQGSILMVNGSGVGSELIGQWFTKPEYFHSRPSVTTSPDPNDASKTIDHPYNAANSGASNLGPTSKKLIDTVTSRAEAYRKENHLASDELIPADAVTASASGLDPDISVANARLQANRVASQRGMSQQRVLGLIDAHTRGPQYGLFGYPRINVLDLNMALDKLAPQVSKK